ncbi:STK36 [Symbiodinium sp. CCMP2592]|nr:STK36 [Symbiodinium sp. CCMP2592]
MESRQHHCRWSGPDFLGWVCFRISGKPGVKGAENIVKYMSDLPNVFEKRGLKILEQGCIRIGASQVRWDELIQQVPDYFDVVGIGCSSKENFGRLVLTRFLQFTADADGLQKLRKFVAEVREKAAPVPRAQRCSAMSSRIPAEVPFLGCTWNPDGRPVVHELRRSLESQYAIVHPETLLQLRGSRHAIVHWVGCTPASSRPVRRDARQYGSRVWLANASKKNSEMVCRVRVSCCVLHMWACCHV